MKAEAEATPTHRSYQLLIDALEWSSAWGGPQAEWFGTVLPRIHEFIPVETILEIAARNGRWTSYLKDYCHSLIVVDCDQPRIDKCHERFSASAHITYPVNAGRSLEMIPDRSIDFVFSFDSLVNAGADVFESYLSQLGKKLKPNGVGFIHHSNLGMYSELLALARTASPAIRSVLIEQGDSIDVETVCHAESMTAKLFEEYCVRAGLQCINQELINWFNRHLIACFSVFTPKHSVWARPNRVLANAHFIEEVKMINAQFELYSASQYSECSPIVDHLYLAVSSQLYSAGPDYECFLDGADGETVWGWAWDKRNPNTQVAVDIYDGEAVIALKVEASQYRWDLAAATKDDGCHAFEYKLPDRVKDGQPHWIGVKVSGINIDAYGSPKEVTIFPKPSPKTEESMEIG